MDGRRDPRPSRGALLKTILATGGAHGPLSAAGSLVRGTTRRSAATDTAIAAAVNTALTCERLTATLYYAALSAPAVMHNPRLGGVSADPNTPGLPPGGSPSHVHMLQAALDAEVKHAASLAQAGATSPVRHVYFPATTFTRMGRPTDGESFLGVTAQLETLSIGLYTVLIQEVLQRGRLDLAVVAGQVLGVEAEHRMLARLIGDSDPPNNLTIEEALFTTVGEVEAAMRPFLTGRGFRRGATAAFAVPTPAQAARLVGRYGTRVVHKYV